MPMPPAAAITLLLVGAASATAAVELPAGFHDSFVAGDLVEPVNFDFLPDGRLLIVERATSRIRLVVPGAPVQPAPVGWIPGTASGFGDQGLLGIAVDPQWPASPYIYVHHTCAATPTIEVVRYSMTGDLAFEDAGALVLDSLSRREVVTDLPSVRLEHNGGTLEFGPDQLLYVALGDDDVRCTAQDRHDLRGKILRLDVRGIPDGPGPGVPLAALVPPDNPFAVDPDPRAGLVWHRGLRNPWSFDFDPDNGSMAIADVGNAAWEEVDVVPSGGRNFGWPLFEGSDPYDPGCPAGDSLGLTGPAYAYRHWPPGTSTAVILGGIAPRTSDPQRGFPAEYGGNVFFLDLYSGRLQRLVETTGGRAIADSVDGQPTAEAWGTGFEYVPRMRFSRDGGLWYLSGSELHRIDHATSVDVPPPGPGDAATLRLSAFPNPAIGAVTIEADRPGARDTRLDVIDAHGRRVRCLAAASPVAAGHLRWTWDGCADTGERVRPGVYFVRLADRGGEATRRIVVLAPE